MGECVHGKRIEVGFFFKGGEKHYIMCCARCGHQDVFKRTDIVVNQTIDGGLVFRDGELTLADSGDEGAVDISAISFNASHRKD